jgi:hypothetical protein
LPNFSLKTEAEKEAYDRAPTPAQCKGLENYDAYAVDK